MNRVSPFCEGFVISVGVTLSLKLFLPVVSSLVVPRRLFCFGSLAILDAVCRYLSLFLLYIKIKTR